METVSLKLEKEFLQLIENIMKMNGYMTKTEFIREAIRDKVNELQKQEMLKNLKRLYGISKHKTKGKELHAAGERAFEELEKKFKSK